VAEIARKIRSGIGGRLRGLAAGRRSGLLDLLPKSSVGCEIGVWKGDFSVQILETVEPRELHLVDPWWFADEAGYVEAWYGGALARTQDDMDQIYEGVKRRLRVPIDQGIVVIHRSESATVALTFADDYFDWVYIDGNHLYEYVIRRPRGLHAKGEAWRPGDGRRLRQSWLVGKRGASGRRPVRGFWRSGGCLAQRPVHPEASLTRYVYSANNMRVADLPLRGAGGEPVDFARTIVSHGVAELAPNRVALDTRTLETTLPVRGGARTVRLTAQDGKLLVDMIAGRGEARIRDTLASTVAHMFRLDEDLSAFYAITREDVELSWSAHGAGRMLRAPTVFEDVVKTI
jgi:hypothetical protein